MKGIAPYLIVGLLISSSLFAQSSPQVPHPEQQNTAKRVHTNLARLLSGEVRTESPIPAQTAKAEPGIFAPDTSWAYEEQRDDPAQPYQPSMYSLQYDVGTPNQFSRNEEYFLWNPDSASWRFSRKQMSYFSDQFLDSTVSFYYAQDGSHSSGSRTTYIREPLTGASSEYYKQYYYPTTGWLNERHISIFYNADSTVYWYQNSLYDEELGKYYLFELSHIETGAEFDLVESRRYNPAEIETWYKRFTQYDEQKRVVYETESRLNAAKDASVPTDSVHYTYRSGTASAETFSYSNQAGWHLEKYTRTFASPKNETEGFKTDSILTYNLIQDDGGNIYPGDVYRKTTFLYDGHDNLLEEFFATSLTTNTPTSDKLLYQYVVIDGEYLQTKEQYFRQGSTYPSYYLAWEIEQRYHNSGVLYDKTVLVLSLPGDTVSIEKTQFIETGDISYSILYTWDKEIKRFEPTDFFAYSNAFPVSQIFAGENEGFGYMRLEVSAGYPAVINNGPLNIELDDTLEFSITAFNPDLSTPHLEIDQLPSTAVFDEDTHQFFWIVDELNPAPMVYTVTDGDLSYSTTVAFISGELAVGAQERHNTRQISLSQNYPNPFNPSTTIGFQLSQPQQISLRVFNILGQEVALLVNEQYMSVGSHSVPFNGAGLASGVYYYQLFGEDFTLIKSMMLLK